MSSREQILQALAQSSIDIEMPQADLSAFKSPATDTNTLLARFGESVTTVAGNLVDATGEQAIIIEQHINDLMANNNQVLSLVEGVSGNQQMPDSPHELQHIDYAILPAKFGVAENGAVWINTQMLNRHDTQAHRALPFICENLIIVLDKQNIIATMHQAPELMSLANDDFGVFISGPSKTADIEQALVVGAHGACTLTIYLV
ncbi:LutC/YkgG family protein [Shewanella gaetbuli]|uniref:LUD domain-containing protein n=1 Tax=Shewanella gaetbuli TaxID=220752 RepID=A0A9X1ZK39_9GAMM|nr:LUD domain-containing protein [Shewanella gaetbuli]MCL1142437.1 LUD domain-containing protein [Shewanella gaetbuli]